MIRERKTVDGYPVFARELDGLLEMQQKLDEAINLEHRGSKRSFPKPWQIQMALLDEIGEVIHELKGDWCYWKKKQKPVDKNLVLGELADCMHFILSLLNYPFLVGVSIRSQEIERKKDDLMQCHQITCNMASLFCKFSDSGSLIDLLDVNCALGFSEEELIQAYKDKHRINYERLANGY